MTWAIVRVRGGIHAKHDLVLTMQELRLNRPNHVAIVPENASFKGMADKVQGYVTWGPVSEETVTFLHAQRIEEVHGSGQRKESQNPETSRKRTASATEETPASGIRMFRLKPPKGGWKSTKKPYSLGGALGFRPPESKDNMDHLIRRML